MEKQSKINLSRIILILIVSLFGQACSDSGDIETRDITWQCEKDICEVSFQLINTETTESKTRYVIRAHKRSTTAIGLQDSVVGETNGTYRLAPGESKHIKDIVKIRQTSDQIDLSAWPQQ